jgi:nicotinamide-nucleotide amidase
VGLDYYVKRGVYMRGEILAVGTEILLGDIVNTNAQYLARRLADLGISVFSQSVVGDNEERLLNAFKIAFERAELVITTGGLGPTKDDLTKEVGAKYFNKEFFVHEESLHFLEDFFAKRNLSVNEGNRKQVYIPIGAHVLTNDYGTAPGCIIEENDKILIMLPGPPKEMKPMFENYVVPYLKKYDNGVLISKVLRICGIGEGQMAEKISDIIENQGNPTVAPYAKEGEVTLRITSKAKDAETAEKLIFPVEQNIRQILGEDIYGIGDTSLDEVVGEKLINSRLTISTAESCTGGLLAGRLINYPGISEVFMEGAVTYNNEAKIKRLEVSSEIIQLHGAVSSETAAAMAVGIAKVSGTNIGISTTGIAGPTGGTKEKPVGLVYVGLSINGHVKTKELRLWGNRQNIRERTVIAALDWLRRELNNIY